MTLRDDYSATYPKVTECMTKAQDAHAPLRLNCGTDRLAAEVYDGRLRGYVHPDPHAFVPIDSVDFGAIDVAPEIGVGRAQRTGPLGTQAPASPSAPGLHHGVDRGMGMAILRARPGRCGSALRARCVTPPFCAPPHCIPKTKKGPR
ncbi:MAG: hypothetical protein RL385_424 [Pseudomonadota bacterium]|jgi:hypothetical protein